MTAASPAIRARAKAAILGGLVADAATMPLHWIYDAEKIKGLVAGKSTPAFFDPPSCPFYQYETGQQSPYGDEILPLLRVVARSGGFDATAFAEASYNFLKAYKGRLNHVSKLFIEARDAGKPFSEASVDDSQAHGIIKVPILVARYAGHSELLGKVEEAVRVHQKNDVSVSASLAVAKVLEKVVLGSSVKEAINWAASSQAGLPEREVNFIKQIQAQAYPSATAIKDMGWSCALPGCFLGSLWTSLNAASYEEGVTSSILAGGDQCSRNIVIGALLAAEGGLDSIPDSWKHKTRLLSEIESLADQVVSSL